MGLVDVSWRRRLKFWVLNQYNNLKDQVLKVKNTNYLVTVLTIALQKVLACKNFILIKFQLRYLYAFSFSKV